MVESNPIMQLLTKMVEWKASDLHLQSETAPYIRIGGHLRPIECRPLHQAELDAFTEKMMDERHRQLYAERGSVDLAYALTPRIRFRANVYHQRSTTSVAFRLIDNEVPGFQQLHLPPAIESITNNRRGIVLVIGPAGSGKSTTLAAMIDYINESRSEHIITAEDPIEFLHPNKKSLIEQREIGADAQDFHVALMHMLRQDPNVILIGEIRDLETVVMSIRAALTGHLVFSTLHTIGAIQTLQRLLQYYQREEREAVRDELALAMRAVISQRFVTGKAGGRIPVVEIMVIRGVVAKLLREERYDDITIAMRGGENGMQTFDQSLVKHFREGLITFEAGETMADDPGGFKRMASGGFSSDDRGSIIADLG